MPGRGNELIVTSVSNDNDLRDAALEAGARPAAQDPREGAVDDSPSDFATALALIARLPISDAERAIAVRQLMAEICRRTGQSS